MSIGIIFTLLISSVLLVHWTVSLPVWQDELIGHHTLTENDIAQVKVSLGRLVRAAQQTFFGRAFEDGKLTDNVKRPTDGKNGQDTSTLVSDFSRILFEGDIVLTPKQAEAILESALAFRNKRKNLRTKRAALLSDLRYRWVTFPIPYYFDKSLSAEDQADIQMAIDFWQGNTCVSYQLTPNPKGDAIEFFKGTGCYSMIGRIGEKQGISIGNGCNSLGIVAHELGHSLGLWHEQSRPDADQFVKILSENIITAFISNFLKRDWSDVSQYGVPYDLGSVMHYGPQAFVNDWAKNAIETVQPGYQSTIGQREHPSFFDVKVMNAAYCSSVCPPLTCFYGGYANVKDCSKCVCPDGLDGILCDKPAPSAVSDCGGLIVVTSDWTEITSPGYNEGKRYATGAMCNWLIRAQPGNRVALEFTADRFQFYCTVTCLDYIEIKNGSDFGATGMRFCCYAAPGGQFISERNEMLVLMRTAYGSDIGFKARVRQNPSDGSTIDLTTLSPTKTTSTTSKTASTSTTSTVPPTTTSKTTTTVRSIATSTTKSTTTPSTTVSTTKSSTTQSTTTPSTTRIRTEKTTSIPTVTSSTGTESTTDNPSGAKWTSWDNWSDCSKSCGGCGLRTRSRECLSFRCEGPNAQVQRCAFELCETKKGRDDCVKVQHFDYPCGPRKDQICTSADEVTFKCDMPHCCAPLQGINGRCQLPSQDSSVCKWHEWATWSNCKGRPCGGCASQTRQRNCATPPCSGESNESRRCNLLPCANCGSFDSSGLIQGSKNATKCACCSPLVLQNGQCAEEAASDQRLE